MAVHSLSIEELGITLTVMWEDPRYPKLIIDENGSTSGYWLYDMERFCICAAHSDCECICGVWEESIL